jgi:hypothetical protein
MRRKMSNEKVEEGKSRGRKMSNEKVEEGKSRGRKMARRKKSKLFMSYILETIMGSKKKSDNN